jgi:hypothetical protein
MARRRPIRPALIQLVHPHLAPRLRCSNASIINYIQEVGIILVGLYPYGSIWLDDCGWLIEANRWR